MQNFRFLPPGNRSIAPVHEPVYAYACETELDIIPVSRLEYARMLAVYWLNAAPHRKPAALILSAGLPLVLLFVLSVARPPESTLNPDAVFVVPAKAQQAAALQTQSPAPSAPAPAPVPGGQMSVEGKPSISVAKIEEVLRSYKSPAAGTGQTMYDLGVKYGIDPAFALAFFVHESTAGTKGVATVTKSIGNIRQTANSGFEGYQGFRKYPSWEAGIEDWYKLIRNLYINGWNKRTVETIIPTYAPAADRNNPPAYINQVRQSVTKWRNGD
jgi:hypothetical protein